jgi:uncharacterized protein
MEPEEFLLTVLKEIVDHPEDVVITRTMDAMGVLLSVRVHPDDMGKVIGKGGRFVNETIRPLLSASGFKHNAKVSVKVDEPIGGKRSLFTEPNETSPDNPVS